MLWRHLAYLHALLDEVEDGAQPLDDDSDLENEVEAFPTVSGEALIEAAACVKVLIASGLPSDSNLPNSSTVEAPLTINIPNGPSYRAPSENSEATSSMQGKNITVPVSVQKQPLPAAIPAEVLDANGSANGNIPPRRKRKPWSEAEDLELIAAVQKFGEGNWANILRGDFKGDRTASQLSQRWAIIRKRRGNLNVGPNSTGSQLSEARRAAHHAMSLALDMPVKNLAAARAVSTNTTSNSVPPTTTAEATVAGSSLLQAQDQSQQGPIPTKSSPVGLLGSTAKPWVSSKTPSTMPTIGSDSVLRATAVAAGARIVSPSDAISFIKATQAKNAVLIKPTGGSSTKSSMPGLGATPGSSHPAVTVTPTASHPGSVNAASPTVQHTSSTIAASSNMLSEQTNAVTSSLPCELVPKQEAKTAEEIKVSHPGSGKAASPPVQHTPSVFATSSNMSSEQTNAVSSSLPCELVPKQEVKTAEEIKVRESGYALKEQIQEDGACVSGNAQSEQVQEDKAPSQDMNAEFKKQMTDVKNPNSSLNMKTAESDHKAVIDNQAEATQSKNDKEIMGSPARDDNKPAP
ncbi:uncharacterized protein LOC132164740 isoform X2 [Corylus avellana]|uniref:uncharacterized protein LOC132164740 isoform X2 n=1 Tax=Corylus avellana TaxID=13451 RepID=UPI00286B3036|nr:uncharacterized protein LOC132164740 isoform X2 [Corylus avellana]